MNEVLYESNIYWVYRFVHSINDMHVNGMVVTDPETIDFWRKRYIWMEWVTRMDNYQLQLMSIGWVPPRKPFLTAHYNEKFINGTREHIRLIWLRRSPTAWRTILVEETYVSDSEAQAAGG